jgi:23S rRNA pseudouridine2605 synthase
MSERIAKVIARATKHSRRGAEYLIAQGCVRVDGKLINSPALNVSASNRLELNNQRIKFEAPSLKLYKYHKPQGVLVTHDDPHGRKTIFDLLPERFENMVTIGRLDSETEGLLLLTNDGDLKRTLELPKNNFRREYTALVKGIVDDHVVNEMSRGIEISRMRYKPIEVVVESYSKQYTWVRLTLTEGTLIHSYTYTLILS